MSSKEVGIEEGRKRLGDLADAAYHRGEITYLTRHGRQIAAIVPIALAHQESSVDITATELAIELNVTRDDIYALVDQLVAIDGTQKVIASETRHEVTLTGQAAETIREQIAASAPVTYTLTLIEGEDRGASNGWDLAGEESPVSYADLPEEATDWLEANGFDVAHPDRWVLVTPADEAPQAVNAIGSIVVSV